MEINVQDCIGKGYGNGWYTNCRARYRVFAGARNTKKSVDILGYEIIFKILSDEIRNVLVIRQNDTDNGTSTFPNLIQLIDRLGLTRFFKFRSAPREIIYVPTGQEILFKGFNNPTSQTSLKPRKGVFTDVYFEEGSELKNFEDFRKVDGSIRIGVKDMERYGVGPEALQLTICMNPWNKSHWIYETFFQGRLEDDPAYLETHDFQDYYDPEFTLGFGKGLYLHKSTFRINEFRSPEYDENMALLKDKSPDIYKVEGLGCWGNSTESTYPEFTQELEIPSFKALEMRYAMYSIGIDFGISDGEGRPLRGENARVGSATTMQLCGVTSDYGKLVCIDEFFHSNEREFTKKTGPELQHDMVALIKEWKDEKYASHPDLMKGRILVYVDSADSGGFRQGLELEARKQGLINVTFLPSTKISIQSRVDFVRLLMAWGEFLVSKNCPNLIRELKNARHGQKGEVRADCDDHATNANEYAWAPFRERIRRWKTFKSH